MIMFTIESNPQQDIVSKVDYINNYGVYNMVPNAASYSNLIHKTSKYLYRATTYSSAPRYKFTRLSYDGGIPKSEVSMTLSGFGTFSSQPNMWIFQGSVDGDYYIYCKDTGGNATFTASYIYPLTISGTTITLGTGTAIPAIGGEIIVSVFAYLGNVYVYYANNSSYIHTSGRKWNGVSWTTLSGDALPSSLQPIYSNSIVGENNKLYNPNICGGNNNVDYHICFGYSGTYTYCYFNGPTESRYLSDIKSQNGNISVDVGGAVFGPGKILFPDGSVVNNFNTSYGFTGGTSDINNGLLFSVSANYNFGYFSGNNRRIRRIFGGANYNNGLLFSIDGGTTWKIMKWGAINKGDNNKLNIYGNLKVFAIGSSSSTTNEIDVEITD